MVSAATRNILGGVCLTCVLCGVLIMWSGPHSRSTITQDTIIVSAEDYYTNGQQPTASVVHPGKTVNSGTAAKKQGLNILKGNHTTNKKIFNKLKTMKKQKKSEDQSQELVTVGEKSDSAESESTSSTTTSTTTTTTAGEIDTAVTRTTELVSDWPHINPDTDMEFPMDYELNDDIGAMLMERRRNVYKACEEYNKDIKKSIVNSRERFQKQKQTNNVVLTSDKHSINFCTVAKSGSTFWKSVFGYIGTGEVVNGLHAPILMRQTQTGKYRALNDLSRSIKKGEDYTSFVAVRNPWKRLVSLYQQKVEAYLPTLSSGQYSKPSDLAHKGMAPYKYMLTCCGVRSEDLRTFEDMIKCVLKKNLGRKPNRHWESAYEYCDICNMNFGYIIRAENMMKEGAYVLDQAGLPEADNVLDTVRNGTIRDVEKHKKRKYSDYYRDLDPDLIELLRRMYKWEIKLFGYPSTPFTN